MSLCRIALGLAAIALTACPGRGGQLLDARADGAIDAVDVVADGSPRDVEAGVDVPPAPSRPAMAPRIQWVDPFMGTGGQGYGTGSTFPGPQTPFGMARPGPDTMDPDGTPPFAHCAGFAYGDTRIQGFSLTRMNGTGIPEYGAIALAPVIGISPAQTRQAGYRSAYDHATERASPGYYRVRLADTNIDVELTATDHVALQRYTFPVASDGVVLLDLGHTIGAITIDEAHLTRDEASGEIAGSVRFSGGYSGRFGGVTVYFAARASRAFMSAGTWVGDAMHDGSTLADGTAVGAYLHFDTRTDATVTVAIGLSFTDIDHARANLAAEAPAVDFNLARSAAEARWETALSVVRIEGRGEDDFRTFYSALYHTLLMPTLATDVDGTYRGIDGQVHHADGFRYYTDFSLWDTYRTEHPLLNLLYPAFARDFARSLTAMAREGGFVPRWPLATGETGGMIGDSADIVLADSWLKGVRDFDLRAAYTVMRAAAMGPTPAGVPSGRDGIASYLSRGYVSIEAAGSSVALTAEYAYDDHALSVLADALGETADAAMFRERGHNWRNLYDPATGFLTGRHDDGRFDTVDRPNVWLDTYDEGNAWQYNFLAPHDIEGLAAAFGGRDAMRARLDTLFTQTLRRGTAHFLPMPFYWPGNEVDLATPWLYAALDDGASTARWTRWIARNFYNHGPAGLPGNDDGGTLSAWYVFAALGFFPVAATPDYLLGSPLLTRSEIALEHGTVIIEAPDESESTYTVSEARWNGAVLPRPRIAHDTLAAGGTLRLTMP